MARLRIFVAGMIGVPASACLGPSSVTQELFFRPLDYAKIPQAQAEAECAYDFDRMLPKLELPPDAMGRLTVRETYAISCMRAKGYELSGVGPLERTL